MSLDTHFSIIGTTIQELYLELDETWAKIISVLYHTKQLKITEKPDFFHLKCAKLVGW